MNNIRGEDAGGVYNVGGLYTKTENNVVRIPNSTKSVTK